MANPCDGGPLSRKKLAFWHQLIVPKDDIERPRLSNLSYLSGLKLMDYDNRCHDLVLATQIEYRLQWNRSGARRLLETWNNNPFPMELWPLFLTGIRNRSPGADGTYEFMDPFVQQWQPSIIFALLRESQILVQK